MTTLGRAHCMRRLSAATSYDDVEAVWARLGPEPRADAELRAHKLRCLRRYV